MKIILVSALILVSFSAKSQTKKDSIPPDPKFSVTMPLSQWQQLFQIIRGNSKMTGAQCEESIEFISKLFIVPKDSVITKKP